MLDASPDSFSDEACFAMWAAVLKQAIDDAKAPRPSFTPYRGPLKRKKGESRADHSARFRKRRLAAIRDHRLAVRRWPDDRAYIGSHGFRQVCWLCGIDPDAAAERTLAQMAPDWPVAKGA